MKRMQKEEMGLILSEPLEVGETRSAFCKRHGIALSTFYKYRRSLDKTENNFIRIGNEEVVKESHGAEICFPDGTVLRLSYIFVFTNP